MTVIESWQKMEKRLVQLGWTLDLDHRMWKYDSKLVDFTNKKFIKLTDQNSSEIQIPTKELDLLSGWIEIYWELNYNK